MSLHCKACDKLFTPKYIEHRGFETLCPSCIKQAFTTQEGEPEDVIMDDGCVYVDWEAMK